MTLKTAQKLFGKMKKFYLHFELRDLNYVEELFAEMLATITDLKSKQTVKILLSCTGGLTTVFFADKLNETAKILSIAVMPFANQTRIAYRIYQKGVPLLNETVIKGKLKIIRDLQDILLGEMILSLEELERRK